METITANSSLTAAECAIDWEAQMGMIPADRADVLAVRAKRAAIVDAQRAANGLAPFVTDWRALAATLSSDGLPLTGFEANRAYGIATRVTRREITGRSGLTADEVAQIKQAF